MSRISRAVLSTHDKSGIVELAKALSENGIEIISTGGTAKLLKGSMVKKGAIVIDLGTSVEQGKTTGDVDFKSVAKRARAITPVPGGVGPLTIACLLENLVTLSSWTSKY